MNEAKARYTVPSKKTLSKYPMADKEKLVHELKSELDECASVALTHDSWTSLVTDKIGHFLGNFKIII